MYLPKHFEQQDAAAMAQLLELHPLATVAWHAADGLSAEHLPLMWERAAGDGAHGTLRGHVARANPVWREAAGGEVLAVFQGPQAYITPSWYASKTANAKVVPTWNYAVVHMHGRLRITEDATWLRALVGRLTDVHEATRAQRWQVGDAPADYIAAMLGAIVGIEIEVVRLQGKWKVSQNRTASDRTGVVAGLESMAGEQAAAMAALVRGRA
ncbi:MAG TPA: FMN-binding negative transcriptional regulator [Rubrivivax sp.]|nr:FMN-binding negative transcriptional regulator [Rubrivivax sp.]